MKLLVVPSLPLLLCVLVAAKRYKKTQSESDYSDSHEIIRKNTSFDLRGSLKRSFALGAALTDPQENVLCSPLSALLPLGKLVFGAEGQARQEITATIGIRKRKQVKKVFTKLIQDLKFLPGVVLDVASRIYLAKKTKLNSNFSKNVKSTFQSDVEKVSFDKPREAVDEINAWVARQTNNMIPTILAPGDISPSTSMILVNAIYFSGKWKYAFQKVFSSTFLSPKGPLIIPMISNVADYNYYESKILKSQILEIPYEGNAASFIIVLPIMKDGLQVLLRSLKLAPEILNSEMRSLTSIRMEVSIPKFKIQSEMDLKVLYEKIGLRTIFNNKHSGLTGIVKDNTVYVSKAVHKAVIEVNEKGTEAAASSAISIGFVTLNMRFIADHPFLFFVKVKGEQLFAGIYNGP
ncbi:antichymotrypsin-2 isoform X2 [Manduca sexta]|uniref:antichymotrypsin-2 isoform X2 n=1 Tax=Manduca sexta TaxID=7130 RepID=UPI00188FE269|nr:antichymotrypsin-2 isoform X2 [Manduca sexta]